MNAEIWDGGVLVRKATEQEINRAEANASVVDGAASVFVGGELVAVCNEYGTAKLRGGTSATPTQEDVEKLLASVLDFMEAQS